MEERGTGNGESLKGGICKMGILHRGPTQSVWVADCYFIVNVFDLPFIVNCVCKSMINKC